ncbi:sigma 54-interacting transcriptional regulator [Sporanaerobacter sp. PP17-6a]|uniref:sigma 54-interacting transcriptional regulator n=1 Tax=Sporanaerobacter sp. PP17-6a TaxID=1891289 RepID=UPI00089FC6A1|nr:sigma 54-interacting transcriptional regulator [Sporanaerobacter sp. PP17-6a]SCL81922.1 Transcriptional regulatory protein ZraR [Sporanaerobacter sp. PP17-6a]
MEFLIKLINEEDKRNPLTDSEIAKMLGISRAKVSKMRESLSIGDCRERRREILTKNIEEILKDDPSISERALTLQLNKKGFKICRNVVSKFIKNEKKFKINRNKIEVVNKTSPKNGINLRNEEKDMAFNSFIGANGSLRPQVELAKAAILYPPNGLHTLIYGETGVGKSELAECMYKFSIETGIKAADSPFISFNCADYVDNPQLLLSQLFGYTKGAFTGADTNKIGLIEKADKGILFLDEIHRLPPEGQEILFSIIDKGRFRRMGEVDETRKVNIMIIAATSEDVESYLLSTFRRRIPMFIELPGLKSRPLEERYNMIINFFKQEAMKINIKIVVLLNVIEALLLYDAKGNIGQLKSDIEVACARGFLEHISKRTKYVTVDISHLSGEVAKGILEINKNRKNISKFISKNLEVFPNNEWGNDAAEQNSYALPADIYREIEDRYKKLKAQNISIEIINKLIADDLERNIQQLVQKVKGNRHNIIKNDLEQIVGHKIIYTVDSMMSTINDSPEYKDETLYYCLATHLAASYERILHNKTIYNPQLKEIKKKYHEEYCKAKEMCEIASSCLNIEIPEDEVAFIAMYLKAYSEKNTLNDNYIGIVVLSHGQVARSMLDVATKLIGENHACSMDMSFNESPSEALKRTETIVKKADRGKGVLLLVDMGSLVSFGKIISEKTGIPVRTCSRVNTLMVIEAIRRSVLPEATLDNIADSIEKEKHNYDLEVTGEEDSKLRPAIVFICITGNGAAKLLKKRVMDSLPDLDKKADLICKGYLTDDIYKDLEQLSNDENILAIVGTIDLNIRNIPFISATEIVNLKGVKLLKNIIDKQDDIIDYKRSQINDVSIKELFMDDLIFVDKGFKSKEEILNKALCSMEQKGYVTSEYKWSVFERENLSPTLLNRYVAIPHGDPTEVKRESIAVIKLQNSIEWCENIKINIIFLLAINDYGREKFKRLFKLVNDKRIFNRLQICKTKAEIKEVIVSGI